jgi:uncharacterized protein (DUF362 family)
MELQELHKLAAGRIEKALNEVCAPALRKLKIAEKVVGGHLPSNRFMESGRSSVAVAAVNGNVKEAVSKAVDAVGGWEKAFNPGDKILLKPNYNSPDPPPGSTDVEFLAAVVELLREAGCSDITVGDCSGLLWHPTVEVFKKTGMLQRMEEMGVPVIVFDDGPWVEVPVEGGEYLSNVVVPQAVLNCDKLVYLPSLKTHSLARFTMGLKLGVGLLHPAMRPATLHQENLEEKCAEINLAVKPDLVIMDGRVAFISGGPATGERVHPQLVMVSGDILALDVEGVKILQSYEGENLLKMDAWDLPVIKHAARLNLGALTPEGYSVIKV